MKLKLIMGVKVMSVISAYAPRVNLTELEKERFGDVLEDIVHVHQCVEMRAATHACR